VELSWSTFILEIINFLVLVWILKHFLYRPVLDIIDKRRQLIEDQLDEAHRLRDEAQELKQQYGGRLAAWDAERRAAADTLSAELQAERKRRLEEIETAVGEEQQKMRVADERKRAEQLRVAEREALNQASCFAARLLADAAGPELETRLVRLAIEQLRQLPEERALGLREQWSEPPAAIEVSSAYELAGGERSDLESALRRVSGLSVPVHFARDETLIAGLCIGVGAWLVAANVRDELSGFAELAVAKR
jgi:F-type H+-transporting ATPase subunit b